MAAPTIQAQSIVVTNITHDACSISCTAGDGAFRTIWVGEAQAVLNDVARGFRRIVKVAGKTVASLIDAEGKPTVSLHELRRTCLTTWSRCVSIQDVMRLAGHSSVTTTQKYYLATTEDQFRLAREAASAALAASRAS